MRVVLTSTTSVAPGNVVRQDVVTALIAAANQGHAVGIISIQPLVSVRFQEAIEAGAWPLGIREGIVLT